MEDLQERVNALEKEVNDLKNTIRIMKETHSFDMGRAFEEIDLINAIIITEHKEDKKGE